MSKVNVLIVDDASFIRDLMKKVCAVSFQVFNWKKL